MSARPLVVLAVFAGVLLGPAPAGAYVVNAPPWPGKRVTYASVYSGNPLTITRAVRAWNSSGVDVRFVRVPLSRAQLVISDYPGACQGYAVASARGVRARVYLSRGGCEDDMARVAAHELGHVLGLGHEDRSCATMNSKGRDRCPLPSVGWQYRCRLLESDDLRGAVRLYGGFALPRFGRFCDRFPPLPAPRAAAAGFDPERGIVASWRNIDDPELELVAATTGPRCRRRPPAMPRLALPGQVRPGRPGELAFEPSRPGPACVTLWSEDRYGRPGPPASARVEVPALPPVARINAIATADRVVAFDSFDSRDPDGGEPTHTWWDFGDGSPVQDTRGGSVEHRYAEPGEYSVALLVQDDEEAFSVTARPVRVP